MRMLQHLLLHARQGAFALSTGCHYPTRLAGTFWACALRPSAPRRYMHCKLAPEAIKEMGQEACLCCSRDSILVHVTVQPLKICTSFFQDTQGLQFCAGGLMLACTAALGAVLMQLTVKPL